MPEVVSPQVVDALTIDNVKTVAATLAAANANLAQMAANAAGLSIQNSVTQQQQMNQIGNALTTQAVNLLLHMDPAEAVAISKALTGNDVAQVLANVLAAINSGQQGVKSAQTTPPVTG